MHSKNRSSNPRYLVGIDFGTLSARGVLVDSKTGAEAAARVFPYPDKVIEEKLPGSGKKLPHHTALQNPADYLAALDDIMPFLARRAKAAGGQICGIGTDFTSSTALPVFADGEPLCFSPKWKNNPHAWVKLWKHHTPQPQADRINAKAASRGEAFIKAYCGRYSSEWFFSKLLETLEQAPSVYKAADYFIEGGDWIVWQLCGKQIRGVSAAGFKAMRVNGSERTGWNFPTAAYFASLHPKMKGVAEKIAGDFLPPGARAGELKTELARKWKLPDGVPIAVGNIDAHAAVPACGVTKPGKLVMIMGTSTCHLLIGKTGSEIEGICGVVQDGIVPGAWGYEAGQAGVGDAFAWFMEHALPDYLSRAARDQNISPFELLERQAAELRPGECGLIALDWWNGNRSILMDADLTGTIAGLNLFTRPHHIYRALIESTAFGTRKIIEAFENKGVRIDEVFACGGLAHKNKLMMQIYADVLGRKIVVASAEHASALGAAMFAGVAADVFADIHQAARQMVAAPMKVYSPRTKAASVYDELHAEYNRLYDYFGRSPAGTLKRLKEIKKAAQA
jgi:L-ribulokinase